MTKFVLGDVVKTLPNQHIGQRSAYDLDPNKIYTVTDFSKEDGYIFLDSNKTRTYNVDRFMIVPLAERMKHSLDMQIEIALSQDANRRMDDTLFHGLSESDLQDLIKTANKGRRALEKLFKFAPERMEIESNVEGWLSKSWRPLKSIKNIDYRLRPKAIMEPWKTSNGWEVTVLPWDNYAKIKIGCKSFNIRALRNSLLPIIKNSQPSENGHGLQLFATKNGVLHDGFVLAWPDAERLLEKLNKLLEKV